MFQGEHLDFKQTSTIEEFMLMYVNEFHFACNAQWKENKN